VRPTFFKLGAMGIHDNGHMMMLEKNPDQIADVMEKWVRKSIAEENRCGGGRRTSKIALLSALRGRGAPAPASPRTRRWCWRR
jgi:hypothetical protein